MKAYRSAETKYYKYVDVAWTRPNLTENGTLGSGAFAVAASAENTQYGYRAWKAVDDNSETYWTPGVRTTPQTFTLWSMEPIKVSTINITNRSDVFSMVGGGSILASNDNENWVTLVSSYTNNNETKGATWSINVNSSDYYNYYQITVTSIIGSSTNYAPAIANIGLVAVKREIQEGTSSDYDFYEAGGSYYLPNGQVRKYYKYSYNSWTRPDLTWDGFVGSSNFAVAASSIYQGSYYAYYAVNGSITDNYNWLSSGSDTVNWYQMYSSKPLNITNFHFYNYSKTGSSAVPTAGTVQISRDGEIWTDIKSWTNSTTGARAQWDIDLSDNTNYSKYYRLYFTANYAGDNKVYGFQQILITAVQRIVVPATSSDYDFYEDVGVYLAPRSFTKGQYLPSS